MAQSKSGTVITASQDSRASGLLGGRTTKVNVDAMEPEEAESLNVSCRNTSRTWCIRTKRMNAESWSNISPKSSTGWHLLWTNSGEMAVKHGDEPGAVLAHVPRVHHGVCGKVGRSGTEEQFRRMSYSSSI